MATPDFVENVIEILKGFCINTKVSVSDAFSGDEDKPTTVGEDDNIETAEKLRAFNLLPIAAGELKPEATRTKLIPVIESIVTTAIDNGDDEALMVIGEKLGDFVPLVGGGSYGSCLLPLLARIICCVEEVVVVQAACDSLNKIIPTLDSSVIDTNCLQLVRNIFADDLYCASRKAGVRLIPVLYQKANADSQGELKHRLLHLCMMEEEIPLVRAAAIEQLVELSRVAGPSLKPELVKTLTTLINDNQRVVRASVVKPTLELAKNVDGTEFENIIMPLLEKMSEDSNRRGLAQVISEFQKIAQKFDKSLHALLIKLMEDNEIDARKIVASQLKEFCSVCPQQILTESVLPKIREHLNLEREDRVKAELVKSVVIMIPDFKREDALPLVQHVLSFLNETNPQTKQYVFEHFRGLIGLISPGELQLTIIPSLFKLFSDKNWRIRSGVVSSIKLIVSVVDEACCRETLLPTVLTWLRDPVCDIRMCSCEILAAIVARFPALLQSPGSNNTAASVNNNSSGGSIVTGLAGVQKELTEDDNYHLRQCWCFLLAAICRAVADSNLLAGYFNSLDSPGTLLKLIETDTVPNVQLTAIRSLNDVGRYLPTDYRSKIREVLNVKVTDSATDVDVKYFSEAALKHLESK